MPLVYLNHAATAWPRAPGVIEAMTKFLHGCPEEPERSSGAQDAGREVCRQQLAALLQVPRPEQIGLTSGATQALNLAILGLPLNPGDRVLTSVTEHNSVLRPLNHLSRSLGLVVTVIGLNAPGTLDLEAWETACRQPVALAVLNHVSNVTGQVNPVERAFALAKTAGATTLLDASQSLGLLPVEPAAIGADLVAFPGHKGLRGPPGTGGLYVAPHLHLRQVFVGGTGTRSDRELHPEEMPTRLEAGTPNEPAWAGLAAALDWRQREGTAFLAQAHRRHAELWQGLAEMRAVRLFGTPAHASGLGPISFQISGWPVAEAGDALRQSFQLVCRTGLHCAPLIHASLGSAPDGTIRFSVAGSNTPAEIDHALASVARLAA